MLTKFKLFENVEEKDFLNDCKPIIKEMKRIFPEKNDFTFLYRGFKNDVSPSGSKIKRNNFREPKDTPDHLHKMADDAFLKHFGWRARSQGVFVFANKYSCKDYGKVYLCFPVGEYEFVYNNDIIDLTPELVNTEENIEEDIEYDYDDEYGENKKGTWIYDNRIDTEESNIENAITTVCDDVEKFDVTEVAGLDDLDELNVEDYVFKNDFTWKPKIELNDYIFKFKKFPQRIKDDIDYTVSSYKNDNLYMAMNKLYARYNEISFNCDYYYLFPLEMEEKILNLIYDN